MYRKILVPVDLAEPALAKPALATATMMAGPSEATIRLVRTIDGHGAASPRAHAYAYVNSRFESGTRTFAPSSDRS